MIKYLLISILSLTLISTNCYAQEKSPRYIQYFAKDQLSVTINSTQWLHSINDVKLSTFSRGVNVQMMYPIIGNKRNVAIAIGFGLACQNYYLNSFIQTSADSIWFEPIPNDVNYVKYKLNTNYVTVPIELRFRTDPNVSNRSFKVYPGIRAGYMFSNKTKYVGRDPDTDEKIKAKLFNIEHLMQFDYGVSLKVGYGRVLMHGYYSLSYLFEEQKGTEITPIEIGATIVLF